MYRFWQYCGTVQRRRIITASECGDRWRHWGAGARSLYKSDIRPLLRRRLNDDGTVSRGSGRDPDGQTNNYQGRTVPVCFVGGKLYRLSDAPADENQLGRNRRSMKSRRRWQNTRQDIVSKVGHGADFPWERCCHAAPVGGHLSTTWPTDRPTAE